MYTKKRIFKIVSFVIICLSTLIFVTIPTTTVESKIFKINEIEISEPFGVNFNKDKVINKAFLSAFDELISTIITTKDKLKIKGVNLKEIKFLIDSFEIKDENFVNQKYIANFNVNFKNYFLEKIQKHIVQKNVKIKNNVYLTTNSGRFLADGIASDLFLVNLK